MKRLILTSTLCAAAAGMATAAQLDLVSAARLRAERAMAAVAASGNAADRLSDTRRKAGIASDLTGRTLAMAMLSDDCSAEDFAALGAEIIRTKGNIALISMPTANVEKVAALPKVRRIQLARNTKPLMDKARKASGVDFAHEGLNLEAPADAVKSGYTGKGVITGIVDAGVDPNHINFRDEEGNTRVGYVGHIRLNGAGTSLLESRYGRLCDLPVSSFTTDDSEQYHGTHTMGIMAGGYKGEAVVAVANEDGTATLEDMENPYYGVATDSEIAVSCGELMDMFIAMGMDDICQFRYEDFLQTGNVKPVVINLSLGSNVGPHDGSDMFHEYVKALVDQDNAIICMSAGNEGDLPIAMHGVLGDEKPEMKTFIRPYVYSDLRYGNLVIYSEDDSEFNAQVVVYNRSRGKVAFSAPVSTNTEGVANYYVSSENYLQSSTDIVSPTFGRAFDGYVGIGSMIDEANDRYYVMIDYYTVNTDDNADDNYLLGFIITPKEESKGKRIDVYSDGQFCAFDSYYEAGWDEGDFNGTISDMACDPNVLVVGSYNNRDSWGALDGYAYSYSGRFNEGYITDFSSWGETFQGEALPHVCAPGATVISSTSSYYVTDPYNGVNDSQLQASAHEGDRYNFWTQSPGTSMASPYVAGSVALWLEADPTLTIADVKEIAMKTAVRDAQVEAAIYPMQWGAGKFNAYEGLKEVLRKVNGIRDVHAADTQLVVTPTGGDYRILLGGAQQLNVEIYDLAGKKVSSQTFAGDEAVISTAAFSSGAYVATVNGCHSAKILVK